MPLLLAPEVIAGLVLKFGVPLAEEIFDLVHKPDPTRDDWKAVFGKLRTYEDARTAAFIAAGKTPTPLPPV